MPYIPIHQYHSRSSHAHNHTDDVVAIAFTVSIAIVIGLFIWAAHALNNVQRRKVWERFAKLEGLSYHDGNVAGVFDGITVTLVPYPRHQARTTVMTAVIRCAVGEARSVPAHDGHRWLSIRMEDGVLVLQSGFEPKSEAELRSLLRSAVAMARQTQAASAA